MDSVREKCGVAGIFSTSVNVSQSLHNCLISLQHRGQESCGMTVLGDGSGVRSQESGVPKPETRRAQQCESYRLRRAGFRQRRINRATARFKNSKLETRKGMGLVGLVFGSAELDGLKGSAGIGHVRYSTTGISEVRNSQPFSTENLAVSYNGNLTNYESAKKALAEQGVVFATDSDTEVLLHLLDRELYPEKKAHGQRPELVFSACKKLMEAVDGAYAIVVLTRDKELIALRDPMGFKPFCIGKKGDAHYVVSESAALDAEGAELVREVKPGEAIYIDPHGVLSARRLVSKPRQSFCMFEFVYFARPDSVIESRTVEEVRLELGKKLAETKKLDVDFIVPVPDSGRSAALGYHAATGIPMREALIKNRYIHRTFIIPGNEQRKRMLGLKLNAIKSFVKGKRIALVDDSIVRGNTMKKIVELVRKAGATEVHLLISCPPIIAPCFMGLDFPTYKELIASDRAVEEIRKELDVDSLTYLSLEKLHLGISGAGGKDKLGLCDACLTKNYPIKVEHPIETPIQLKD